MRRTKIVATVGPASSDPAVIRQLALAGVDVFRLNFSHGSREEHIEQVQVIREVCDELGSPVAILQDLCGPKIRAGEMADGCIELTDGDEVAISSQEVLGTASCFSTNYAKLSKDLCADDTILLNDGALELSVVSVGADAVQCRVIRGGPLASRKGVNLPGAAISSPSVTAKDMADLAVGIEAGVDLVALSFVRSPEEIVPVRRELKAQNCPAQIIAKIEKAEAIAALDDIIAAFDGVLVARGDLGVEMDLAEVPLLQKRIVRQANEQDKYVIVATQMLESMMVQPQPTRAEVADVTNAILDGTDAIMLSGETAIGQYPVESVQMMDRVARKTEVHIQEHRPLWDWTRINPVHPVQDAIGHAACKLVADMNAKAVVAYSASGGTALFLSKSRPRAPILAFTGSPDAFRRMRLFWGVEPILDQRVTSREELLARAAQALRKRDLVVAGDTILLVAGSHFGHVGSADTIEIATIGAEK